MRLRYHSTQREKENQIEMTSNIPLRQPYKMAPSMVPLLSVARAILLLSPPGRITPNLLQKRAIFLFKQFRLRFNRRQQSSKKDKTFSKLCTSFLEHSPGRDISPSLKTLDTYCDYVASAVGRLTSPIFGLPAQSGVDLAHHLGRALQLTNILRDIDEDAAMGRIYLPREMLMEAGLHGAVDPAQIGRHDLTLACEPLVQLARQHFMAARATMRQRPREEIRAPLLMADVYEPMLEAMMERGFDPPRRPIKRSKLRMLLLMLGSKLR